MTSALQQIREMARGYPEAERAFLFGDHEVFRVRKKVFVWLGEGERGGTWVSVKLKQSQAMALGLPFVTPSAYGMAKWGWINADFPKGKTPLPLIAQWLDESYRATAPKKLLAALDAKRSAPAVEKKSKSKSKSKKR